MKYILSSLLTPLILLFIVAMASCYVRPPHTAQDVSYSGAKAGDLLIATSLEGALFVLRHTRASDVKLSLLKLKTDCVVSGITYSSAGCFVVLVDRQFGAGAQCTPGLYRVDLTTGSTFQIAELPVTEGNRSNPMIHASHIFVSTENGLARVTLASGQVDYPEVPRPQKKSEMAIDGNLCWYASADDQLVRLDLATSAFEIVQVENNLRGAVRVRGMIDELVLVDNDVGPTRTFQPNPSSHDANPQATRALQEWSYNVAASFGWRGHSWLVRQYERPHFGIALICIENRSNDIEIPGKYFYAAAPIPSDSEGGSAAGYSEE